jgi:hypothetical protein
MSVARKVVKRLYPPSPNGRSVASSRHRCLGRAGGRLLVEWATNGFRATIQDMGIDHGGLHVSMPEQFLHGPNIVAGFQ